jgi:RNA polymerase sigma-70 factor, ECF subfamily
MTPWETLVHEHLPVVTGVALRVLGDRASAEDVAQDVFLHFLQNPRALDNVGNIQSFLCRSAINKALDRLREGDRRARREAAFEQAPRDPDPLDAAWHDEIRRSVEALPEAEREAVAARYFRGLTVREAAKEMQVSVGTVCNRLEAGVKRLRKWLGAAAFGLMFAVFNDDAFAVETADLELRLVRRTTKSGDGSSETGAKTRGRRLEKVAAGIAGIAALFLISIWIGPPGELAVVQRRPLDMASTEPAPREGAAVSGDPADQVRTEVRAGGERPSRHPVGELFRAEGFLVRDGDGFVLVEPVIRDPKHVEGPSPERLANSPEQGDLSRSTAASQKSSAFRSLFREGVDFYQVGSHDASCARFAAALDLGVDRDDLLYMRDELNWKSLQSMLMDGGDVRSTALRIMEVARSKAPAEATNGRLQFHLEHSDLLNNVPAGSTTSFTAWIDGQSDISMLPRCRLVLKAEWIDKEKGLAGAIEILETEFLSDQWLTAWREALQANESLASAFDLPPGAQRRADAMVAADRLESALSRARASRQGETAVSWRTRRESEIEIASATAVAVLGREEVLPDGPAEDSDSADFIASRAVGLELEPVPAIQQGALALRGGARVLAVAPGSAADLAGLRPGDVIWRMTPLAGAGRSTPRLVLRPEDVSAFVEALAESGGSGLEFEVVRGMDVIALTLGL